MNIADLKKQVCEEIDKNREKIIEIGQKIYSHPELGYKEHKTSELVINVFKELGLDPQTGLALTGCSAELKGSKTGSESGPSIAVMGELDAVSCPDHKDADSSTGAVHACGHNIQIAAMLGAASGLINSGAAEYLSGSVNFMAVPAEEFIELAFRSELKEKGEITYFGGKQELIKKGFFDKTDIAMMVHALNIPQDKNILIGPKGNGFIGKEVKFTGREAHAGSAPEDGINALNAAMLAMNNIHAQRETFSDQDRIRVHPIITKGGDIVNVVPSDVRIESYVRGRTIEGLIDANKKVNRAIKAGALAVGADVEITDIPGYLPLLDNTELDDLLRDNAVAISGEDSIIEGGDFTGSFDFGDLSHIIPALHPMTGGVEGGLHTRNFKITDHEAAYIIPAKAMAMTVIDLLFNNAEKALEIMKNFKPVMTKKEYLEFMESVSEKISFKSEQV